jgi:hypothetical protein
MHGSAGVPCCLRCHQLSQSRFQPSPGSTASYTWSRAGRAGRYHGLSHEASVVLVGFPPAARQQDTPPFAARAKRSHDGVRVVAFAVAVAPVRHHVAQLVRCACGPVRERVRQLQKVPWPSPPPPRDARRYAPTDLHAHAVGGRLKGDGTGARRCQQQPRLPHAPPLTSARLVVELVHLIPVQSSASGRCCGRQEVNPAARTTHCSSIAGALSTHRPRNCAVRVQEGICALVLSCFSLYHRSLQSPATRPPACGVHPRQSVLVW